MTTERERIIAQVRKLSDLANPESGAFEGEIANASAAMQRLMDKYSISMGEVYESKNAEIDEKFASQNADAMFGAVRSWHWTLARVIARITHTRHFSTGTHVKYGDAPKKTLYGYERDWGKTIGFYGKETNAEIAASLFVEWLNKLTLMAMQATGEYCTTLVAAHNALGSYQVKSAYRISNLRHRHPNVYRVSWIEGCLSAMMKSVREQESDRSKSTSVALMVVDKKIEVNWQEFSKHMNHVSLEATMTNMAGYSAGEAVGSTLHIGQKAVTGRNKQLPE